MHYDKTIAWANEMDEGLSEEDAKIVAKGDTDTDSPFTLDVFGNYTAPFYYDDEYATGYHFNTNQDNPDRDDSRDDHYEENFNMAVKLYKAGNKRLALRTFGMGLHAKQDIYAHWIWKPIIGEINPHHAYFKIIDCKRGSVECRGDEFFGKSTKAFDNPKYDLRFGNELIRTSVIEEDGRQYYTYSRADVYVAYSGGTRIADTKRATKDAIRDFVAAVQYTKKPQEELPMPKGQRGKR